MTDPPLDRAAAAFAAELGRWRVERAMSKRQLAGQMGFDPSYISHVESRRHPPTEDFARRAELVLRAGGAIWHRYTEYDRVRARPHQAPAPDDPPVRWLPPGTGLVIEREIAALTHTVRGYVYTIRRDLYNAHTEPVTRCPVRVMVDRYPGEPDRSRRFHRANPLTWSSLELSARCGDEPMRWRAVHDWDALKQVWLLFENDTGRFPLYPGQRATIEYRYRLDPVNVGSGFQRTVRLPTRNLVLRLDFPGAVPVRVWGTESTLTAESVPLRTPIVERWERERHVYEWATDEPPLHARFRLEWATRSVRRTTGPVPVHAVPATSPATGGPTRPEIAGFASLMTPEPIWPDLAPGPDRAAARTRVAGILQRGQPILSTATRPLDLPAEAGTAHDLVEHLLATLGRTGQPAGSATGLSAPQVGVDRSVAVLLPAGSAVPITLINPRVVGAGPPTDERYETCLSFPDVRGLVPRPAWIEVAHAMPDGRHTVTRFLRGLARLAAHAIDHLEGRLYPARMAPGMPLVAVLARHGSQRPRQGH